MMVLCRSSCLLLRASLPPRRFSRAAVSRYVREERGRANTAEYRVYLKTSEGKYLSPFHDVPLYAPDQQPLFNMVVEIPRWSNAKMEIATREALNPLRQDVGEGKLRYVANIFPHRGYLWNYGALPQTWEDPAHTHEETACPGDGDPIDVCDIGDKVCSPGQVIRVKVLGILALIDGGETDWKVIAINADDPGSAHLNGVEDVQVSRPGLLEATVDWFRNYKVPDGKPQNHFAFRGAFRDKDFAVKVISSTHRYWRALVHKRPEHSGIACQNWSVCESPYRCTDADAAALVNAAPVFGEALAPPAEVEKWHFLSK